MSIMLVQHGKNVSRDVDPEKGLSEEGISEVERIAEVAGGYGVKMEKVFHSGKKRAKQTADIFIRSLNPDLAAEEIDGMGPVDDVTEFWNNLDASGNVMLVGHLPFMEKLTSYLVAGNPDNPVLKFQNGGIVCLDMDSDSRSWVIKWTLLPNIG
jgi:phosphohistidine phosphatase